MTEEADATVRSESRLDGDSEATVPLGEDERAKLRPPPVSSVVATSGDAMLHFGLHYIASGQRAVYGWCLMCLSGV